MPRKAVWSAAQQAALIALPTAEHDLRLHYTLSENDLAIIRSKRGPHNRLGFAISALGSVLRPARPETRTGRCNGGGCSGKVWRSKPGAPFLGREMPPLASPGEAPRSRATSRAKLY